MSHNAELPNNNADTDPAAGDAAPQPSSRLSAVRLEVHIPPEISRTLKFPPNARILIGRSEDDETASDLMLDFAPLGGESNGVSRVHAAISDREGQIYITDLESTSGTRINGLDLVAHQPYRLYEGDEIELGSARLTIFRIGRS